MWFICDLGGRPSKSQKNKMSHSKPLLVKTLYLVSGCSKQPIPTWPDCGFPWGTPATHLVMATRCGVLSRSSSSPSSLSGGAPARPHTSSPGSGTSLSSSDPLDLSGGLGSDRKWGALYKTRGAKKTQQRTQQNQKAWPGCVGVGWGWGRHALQG